MVSLVALPMVICNLGAEMVYILNQRLQAQCIETAKSNKVLEDIILAWFNNNFVEELFRPQRMFSLAKTRQVFEHLAHASIMRLSENSMDKLFDLMVMGFKYQVLSCVRAQDLLQVTLEHIAGVRRLVARDAAVEAVDTVQARVLSLYESLPLGAWASLRASLAHLLQDRRVKVSLLLTEGIQALDGRIFLPPPVSDGSTMPVGTLTRYPPGGQQQQELLHVTAALLPVADFLCHPTPPGQNLYDRDRVKAEPPAQRGKSMVQSMPPPQASPASAGLQPHANSPVNAPSTAAAQLTGVANEGSKQQPVAPGSGLSELNLLASLIKPVSAAAGGNFRLHLFDDDRALAQPAAGSQHAPATAHVQTVTFDEHEGGKTAAQDMLQQLDLDAATPTSGIRTNMNDLSRDDAEDLLALMDSVS